LECGDKSLHSKKRGTGFCVFLRTHLHFTKARAARIPSLRCLFGQHSILLDALNCIFTRAGDAVITYSTWSPPFDRVNMTRADQYAVVIPKAFFSELTD
jgi:hypothetical protein